MSELKPCPFCGGEAKLRETSRDIFRIECINPFCIAFDLHPFTSKESAIKAWNTRAYEEKNDAN